MSSASLGTTSLGMISSQLLSIGSGFKSYFDGPESEVRYIVLNHTHWPRLFLSGDWALWFPVGLGLGALERGSSSRVNHVTITWPIFYCVTSIFLCVFTFYRK